MSHRSAPVPRKGAVYFDSMAKPAAAPAKIHQAPLPVLATLASANRNSAAQAIAGASGVATIPSTLTMRVRLKNSAARTASEELSSSRAALRQTAQVAISESSSAP